MYYNDLGNNILYGRPAHRVRVQHVSSGRKREWAGRRRSEIQRERETERNTERERQSEIQRERQSERQRERQRDRERHSERQREREREKVSERESDRRSPGIYTHSPLASSRLHIILMYINKHCTHKRAPSTHTLSLYRHYGVRVCMRI